MTRLLVFSARSMEFGGGFQNWIMRTVPGLQKKYGYEILLLDTTYGLPHRIPLSQIKQWAARNDVTYRRLSLETSIPILGPRGFAQLRAMRRTVDAVYYGAGIPSFDPAFASVASSSPSIAGWHGPLMVRSRLQNFYSVTARRLVTRLFVAHHVLNYSDAFTLRRLGMRNVFVIPLAIEEDRWRPDPKKWDDRAFRVTFLGRAEWDKGFDLLVDVIQAFLRENPDPDILVSIVGSGSMVRLGDAIGDARCSLLGYIEDPQPLLSKSHCILVPSRFETFGISILEAMSCENVVVSYKTPGSSLLIRDADSGFLVSSKDELLDRLRWVYDAFRQRRDVLKRIAERASLRAGETFSTERHLERFDGMVQFAMRSRED